MKLKEYVLIIVFALSFCCKDATAQTTYVWQGGTSGSWNTPANWKVGGVTQTTNYPGSNGSVTNDIAQIPTGSTAINITYTGTHTIGQLQTTGYSYAGAIVTFSGTTPSLTINNGLSIAQPRSAISALTFSGTGSASIAGTATFNYHAGLAVNTGADVTFTGTVSLTNGVGNLPNAGTLTCSGCTFDSNGYITNTGTLNVTGSGANIDFTGTPSYITNSGTVNVLSGGTITFGNDYNYLSNASGGTVNCSSGTISLAGSGAYFVNSGTAEATGGTFSFGNGNYIQNNSGATFTTQSSSVFSLNTTGSYITNAGTWTDHGSTYTLEGQDAYIKNTNKMSFRGATINLSQALGANAQTLNNSSTLTIDSASTINAASYTSGVINSGTFYAGTSNSSCVINLTAQSAYVTSSNTFYLGSTSIIYPTAILTYITNTSPGVFTLQSDAYGSAAIGPLNATVGDLSSVNGTFNVERYYQGSTVYDNRWVERNYRIISSPVHNSAQVSGNNVFGLNYIVGSTAGETTTANSATNAFITGCTGGSTSAGNPSIYLYRESYTPANATFTDGNFIGITNITNSSGTGTIGCSDGGTYSLPVGTGVFFFDRGAATNWSTRTALPFIAPENVTLTTTGLINTFSIAVKDWYTPTSTSLGYTGSGTGTNYAVRGFNMIGNPYPCTIDWCTAYASSGITRSSTVSPSIWVYNPQTDQYDTFTATSSSGGIGTGDASRYIMSGQGFFVQATGTSPSPTLTFTESAKAAAQLLTGTNLLMGSPTPQLAGNQVMRLKLMIDSLNYDDIALVFNSSASTRYNSNEDAMYIRGSNAPEGLSSFSDDNVKLSINSLPLPGLAPSVIRLSIDATRTGTYTFQKTALDAIPKLYDIWLMDNFKKDSLNIRNNSTYIFDVNTRDTATYGDNRFQLIIRQDPALMIHLLNFTATKANGGSQVEWSTENEENYTNFTLERSTDGGATFTVLDGMAANGQGTYSFLDTNPALGANSYRLKITDINGTVTYSNVVTLMYANSPGIAASNIRIYPNPATSVVNLTIDQTNSNSASGQSALQADALNPGFSLTTVNNSTYDIKIINMKGSVVKTATTSQQGWQESVGDLPPGTYIVNVTNRSNNRVVGSGTFMKL
jgi:hypothetical protein